MERIYVRPLHSLLDSVATQFGINPTITFEIVAPDDKPNMCIWVPDGKEDDENENFTERWKGVADFAHR